MCIPHQPLRKENQEIRILVLEHAPEKSLPLRCRLEHALLSNATYSAISYVWGQQEDNKAQVEIEYVTKDLTTGEMRVEALSTTIGANLGQALFHLRKVDEDLRLWADAICINQQDDVEKSWQVHLMGNIYKTAELTYVWFGHTPEDYDEKVAQALDAIMDIGSRAKASDCCVAYGWKYMGYWLVNASFWLNPKDALDEEEGAKAAIKFGMTILEELVRTDRLVELYSLLESVSRLPWWIRVWVLQEYAFATSVMFVYGDRRIGGDEFYLTIVLTYGMRDFLEEQCFSDDLKELTRQFVPHLGWRMPMFTLHRHQSTKHSLKFLMSTLYLSPLVGEATNSSDPRDKVFALLGLTDDKMSLEADYERDVEEVYTDTAIAFLASGDASLLCLPRPVSSRIKLPSWVIDWTDEEFLGAVWKSFSASKGSKPRIEIPNFHDGFRVVLGLEGAKFCSISKAGSRSQDIFETATHLNGQELNTGQIVILCNAKEWSSGEIAWVREQIQPHIKNSLPEDRDPRADDLIIEDFARLFRHIRAWINELLKAIRDLENSSGPEWQKTLDIVLLGSKKSSNKNEKHTSLCGRVDSTEDLLKPSNWLTDLSDELGRATMTLVILLASRSRIFTSGCGRIGYAPDTALEGDQIVVFYGVPSPLVIREVKPGYYTIIGPAYVYGVMEGEFLRNENLPSEAFRLV